MVGLLDLPDELLASIFEEAREMPWESRSLVHSEPYARQALTGMEVRRMSPNLLLLCKRCYVPARDTLWLHMSIANDVQWRKYLGAVEQSAHLAALVQRLHIHYVVSAQQESLIQAEMARVFACLPNLESLGFGTLDRVDEFRNLSMAKLQRLELIQWTRALLRIFFDAAPNLQSLELGPFFASAVDDAETPLARLYAPSLRTLRLICDAELATWMELDAFDTPMLRDVQLHNYSVQRGMTRWPLDAVMTKVTSLTLSGLWPLLLIAGDRIPDLPALEELHLGGPLLCARHQGGLECIRMLTWHLPSCQHLDITKKVAIDPIELWGNVRSSPRIQKITLQVRDTREDRIKWRPLWPAFEAFCLARGIDLRTNVPEILVDRRPAGLPV